MVLDILWGTLRNNIIRAFVATFICAFVAQFILKSCYAKFHEENAKSHKGLARDNFWHAKKNAGIQIHTLIPSVLCLLTSGL